MSEHNPRKENNSLWRKNLPLIITFPFLLIVIFCFFQYWYPCHFFYQEQNQLFLWDWEYVGSYFNKPGGLSRLCGDFLTQLYYYLYAGACILTVCLMLIGLLLHSALRHFGMNRHLALTITLIVMLFLAACHFNVSYRLYNTISVLGWVLVVWLISLIPNRWLKLSLIATALLPTYVLFGYPHIRQLQKPNFVLEQDFAIDSEYRFGNYDRVVSLVEQTEDPSQEMKFFYNLVMAQRGELPDHLLQLPATNLGTFYHIGPDTPLPTIRMMNELYWALGDMTFTERAAMMACVFSANNRNVRMVRRLAECNLVSGNEAAAAKYLRLLSHTLAYRQTARQLPQKIAQSGKAAFQNRQDTLAVSDNAHFLMMQLLDSNPDNTVALDYLLCSDLLLKDINNFKRDYDRYCTDRPRLKRLYQEALCIYLAGTNAPEEQWRRYIVMGDVVSRFSQYNQQRRHPSFKGTYWYYFDTAKPPVPQ
jgi:hypothetical protein